MPISMVRDDTDTDIVCRLFEPIHGSFSILRMTDKRRRILITSYSLSCTGCRFQHASRSKSTHLFSRSNFHAKRRTSQIVSRIANVCVSSGLFLNRCSPQKMLDFRSHHSTSRIWNAFSDYHQQLEESYCIWNRKELKTHLFRLTVPRRLPDFVLTNGSEM